MNKTIEAIKVFNYDMSCPDLQRDAGQTYRVQYEMGKTYFVKWSPIRRDESPRIRSRRGRRRRCGRR